MHRFSTLAVIAVSAVTLAACGGGSGSGGSGPTGGGGGATTTTATAQGKAATKFSTTTIKGVGTVLVDGNGRTVYIETNPPKKNVPCTTQGGCVSTWLALPLPTGTKAATAGAGVNKSLLGTLKQGGQTFPTYNGYLMYEYTGDHKAGDANGQGQYGFGGSWYLLGPDGKPVGNGAYGF